MEDLTNIWNTEDELNEEQLLDYIKGVSAGEDMHAVERTMAASSFVNDGVEGLQQFSSPQKINAYVHQINEDLQHKLSGKKLKKKNNIGPWSWEIIAIIVVVLLCLLSYTVVEMMRK